MLLGPPISLSFISKKSNKATKGKVAIVAKSNENRRYLK
jgi:hypothetical protein